MQAQTQGNYLHFTNLYLTKLIGYVEASGKSEAEWNTILAET